RRHRQRHEARLRLPDGSAVPHRLRRPRHDLLDLPDHVRRVQGGALRGAAASQAHGARGPARPEDRARVLRLEHQPAVVISDPAERGRALAEFAQAVIPRLWSDLESSGVLPDSGRDARDEWTCFALYACVRGLVAAGGFNRETAAAIDTMHTTVLE